MGVYIIKTEIDRAMEKAWRRGEKRGQRQGVSGMARLMKFYLERGRGEELREAVENAELMRSLIAEYKAYIAAQKKQGIQ